MNGVVKEDKKTAETDKSRGFSCKSCKRMQIYNARYQCIVCPDVAICKPCFGKKYHDEHEYVMRPQPDRDWEPAFRNNNSA